MTFQNFRPDTTYYQPENAWCLGQAAKLAYQDPTTIESRCREWRLGMTRFLKSPKRARYDTQAFVAANDRLVVVAFRGTEPEKLEDWLTDVNAVLIQGPFGGRVHAGFYLALESVWKDLLKALRESQTRGQSLWFTGHSLGGALASLAAARLRDEFDKPVYGLYTFGQPRVGDRIFERAYNQDNRSRSFRFVNNNDIVTRVPTRLMGYSHIGTFLYFDHEGRLQRDPHYWFQFLDRFEGRIEDLGKPLSEGLKDHFMEAYLDRLERNRTVDPF